jgi:hypothetical protein
MSAGDDPAVQNFRQTTDRIGFIAAVEAGR